MSQHRQRSVGPDVVRCMALFCVVAVHFFLYTDFYDVIITGYPMLLLVLIRSALMVSVPLFLILSGYLLCKRMPTRDYYLRLLRILFVYVAASILYSLFRIFLVGDRTLKDSLWGIFSFSTLDYSWYIEMYLGLFLLIPYLNILYQVLTQKQKLGLIFSLALLSSLPAVLNIHRFDFLPWWQQPSINTTYQLLVPDWWYNLYPLAYYLIGCYLKEYPLRMKRSDILKLFFAFTCISGAFNYYRSQYSNFIWGLWQRTESPFIGIPAVLIFAFLVQGNYDGMDSSAKRVLAWVSDHSLGAYLISQMYEEILYRMLPDILPILKNPFLLFLVGAPLVLAAALLTSWLIHWLYRLSVGRIVKKGIAQSPGQ